MALSLTKSDAADALWIPLGVAAVKLNMNAGSLRRKCAAWQRDGLARRVGAAWQIHAAADPRLGDRRNWRQADLEHLAELDARGIAPKYIAIAKRRRDILHGLLHYQCRGNPGARERRAMYLAHLRAEGADDVPSVTQLYEWQRAYDTDGLRALVPQFAFRAGAEEGGGAVGDAALDRLDELLNCGNRITVAAALAIARGDAARHPGDPRWRIGSYRSVLLAVEQRRPKILRALSDKGEKRAVADHIPKIQRDTQSIPAGDEYCGDERTVDVWCRVLTSRGWKAIRPKITAWMCMRSRVIVGYILRPHADSNTILAALKRAISHYGKPLTLRTDWGEDYKRISRHPKYRNFDGAKIGSVLDELGIDVRRTAGPYQPWVKPIEPFFQTMKSQWDVLHAAFWGGCPSERHEDRAKYVRANLEKLPTLEELSATLDQWLDIYHATPHGATDLFGKTPMEGLSAFRDRPIARESDAVLAHLFKCWTGPKLVRRDGVRHLGRWFGTGDSRLVPMQGRRVVLAFDVDDASRAMVCELNRKPLFEIEAANITGLTARELAARIKEQKRILRPFQAAQKRARAYILDQTPADLLRRRAEGLGINPAPPAAGVEAASLRLRTDLESAIEAAGPAPSAARPNLAVRTGTDDEAMTLDDLLDPAVDARLWSGPADADDDATLADVLGDEYD